MRFIYFILIISCLSCNNERVLLLPEIENAEVTEVLDVSPAYIFYDETQPDSTLLNRKNLIITTNWLVNVDKRLTLRQAIPHIKFLQDKKRNAEMHKNEDAKNYFSCNDISIQNLGFMDFTEDYYKLIDIENDSINLQILNPSDEHYRKGVLEHGYISLSVIFNKNGLVKYKNGFIPISQYISEIPIYDSQIVANGFTLNLYFDKDLTFQDYISIKSELSKFLNDEIILGHFQYIY
ncbi:hypothetical protein [Winogradskyella endarachnes]|uniref:Uncharacterized protein n=1 Tax=Winogradskyella endarachnes TaxID=2681965 RepID=A0A6L6UBB5_9FLAO|nr:hypothetical protein [Winogradskyella endarachnes]MUU78034.1 hypothetical protein [Winogradskyella endarachnes]